MKNKTVFIALISVLVFWIVGGLLYSLFGHSVIEDIYAGQSHPVLNSLIASQDVYPVSFFTDFADQTVPSLLFIIPLFCAMFYYAVTLRPAAIWKRSLAENTRYVERLKDSSIPILIALAAGVGLYAELMIIRVHSSFFQLFAYFKNISLLSCFLGLGIGYARGKKRPLEVPLIIPYLALQFIALAILRFSPVERLFQNPIAEQFGLGMQQAATVVHVLVVYVFLLLIFAFNALCFIPLGQLTSALMARRPNLEAYSWNLIGSIAGILFFTILAYFWTPPVVWVLFLGVGLYPFLKKTPRGILPSLIAIILMACAVSIPFRINHYDVYSPYQLLTVSYKKDGPVLKSSNTYYQTILDLRPHSITGNEYRQRWERSYSFPYHVKPAPRDVLIVGSGTGNDVAAAVRNDAETIDAVEIDPAIVRFGKELHPEFPYQAENVSVHITDARAYLSTTSKEYDLIVYGLLDSHTLLSGRSGGIRLDSYVYTVEGLRQARSRLKKDGVISLTFVIINDMIAKKLFRMITEAFDGRAPIVYKTENDSSYTFLAGERLTTGDIPPHPLFYDITDTVASLDRDVDVSTDDWPFFYMPTKKYPFSYFVMIMLIVALSVVMIKRTIGKEITVFSPTCFFLGAGFMLLETKAITELSLVFGSTWIVISIVIVAILTMAYLANMTVLKRKTAFSLPFVYGFLIAAIVLGWGYTFISFTGVPLIVQQCLLTVLLTIPLFFAGIAFSSALANSPSVAVALSSNLFGAMLGGALEYNSMFLGFRALYGIAIVMYVAAYMYAKKK